jgi:hypothetical protein
MEWIIEPELTMNDAQMGAPRRCRGFVLNPALRRRHSEAFPSRPRQFDARATAP